MKNTITSMIDPVVQADTWGLARALSFQLDHQYQPLMPQPLGLPDVKGNGFSFHAAIGALGIVAPFNWPEWKEPHIEKELVEFLDDDTAWRHVTRIVRSERFCEGNFDACVRDGSLTALVRHLYFLRYTDNGRPWTLPAFHDGTVEPGIRLVGTDGVTTGHTTGRSSVCVVDGCGRWSIRPSWQGVPRARRTSVGAWRPTQP